MKRWLGKQLSRRTPLRRLLVDCLVEARDPHVLRELAAAEGIAAFVAQGDCGTIQGGIQDRFVFAEYLRTGRWASDTVAMMSEVLREAGGSYLDVGGNIGLTAIPMSWNADVQVSVFEPEPANQAFLRANVAANCPHDNVAIYNLALFDRETTMEFEINPDNPGDSRIRTRDQGGKLGESSWPTTQVRTAALDDLALDLREPLVAKIDTQGAESFVIAGGRTTLARAALLAIELWPYGMARMGGAPHAVIEFLRQHFDEGRASEGDRDAFGKWEGIDAFAARLLDFVSQGSDGEHRFMDVVVRKQPKV